MWPALPPGFERHTLGSRDDGAAWRLGGALASAAARGEPPRAVVCGPPSSGKTSLLFAHAHRRAAAGDVVLFIARRHVLEVTRARAAPRYRATRRRRGRR